ncbi:MAG: hypothetical protein H7A01_07835 [Hahellaceae bacterium]|jgi:hypothetical protein|nr:hypothetical protein [Hahellaceae bacterium]MCP5211623.1 hypothetical protein [Hahellaceae bacterium]
MLPFVEFWKTLGQPRGDVSRFPEVIEKLGRTGSLSGWMTQASDVIHGYMESVDDKGADTAGTKIVLPSVSQAFFMGCLASGAGSGAVGRAFFAGYQLAIRELFHMPYEKSRFYSYCITESEGNHPRNIQTTCHIQGDQLLLNGTKTFVTAPDIATDLLIVVSRGWRGSINELGVLHCCLTNEVVNEKVRIDVFPSMAFVPEVRHGSITLKQALLPIEILQQGAGYETFVKPFRWYEDIHVFAALFGMATSVAITSGDQSVAQRLLGLSHSLCGLRPEDHANSYAHLVCAGVMEQFRSMEGDITRVMYELSEAQGQAWERDRRIVDVAGAARKRRAELAWQKFTGAEI